MCPQNALEALASPVGTEQSLDWQYISMCRPSLQRQCGACSAKPTGHCLSLLTALLAECSVAAPGM